MLTYSKWEISPPTVTSYPTLSHKREREREGRTREHEESERQRKWKTVYVRKTARECVRRWYVRWWISVQMCVCVCALWPNWFCGGPGGLRWKKKNLLKVLLFPRDRCQIVTRTHSAVWQSALLWLRCHLSQARCGWAGSCVCGCFALGLCSRIFIINEVTDYTFQISSCSMCRADVVSLSVFPLWYIFIDIYSTRQQHTVYLT